MRRFSETDVRGIISQDHLWNTAHAIGKKASEVTADELIAHWLQFHIQMEVVQFNVGEPQDAFFYPEESEFFHPDLERSHNAS